MKQLEPFHGARIHRDRAAVSLKAAIGSDIAREQSVGFNVFKGELDTDAAVALRGLETGASQKYDVPFSASKNSLTGVRMTG